MALMRRKAFILAVSIFMAVGIATPTASISANQPTPAERIALLAQINTLLEQIQVLQELILKLEEESSTRETLVYVEKTTEKPRLSTAYTNDNEFEIRDTHYFGSDFEAIYEVERGLTLIRRDRSTGVRVSDLRLWDLFVDTVGRRQAARYIDELRIFDKSASNLAAFVELHRSSRTGDYWILGINEDDFDARDSVSRRSYTALFIHEFAHLLVSDRETEDLFEDFKDTFWGPAERAHAKRIENYTEQRLDAALEAFYDDNEDNFVSDYATYNADEDFAETFAYFILNDKPRSSNERWKEKVLFFHSDDRMMDVRDDIRRNIDL